MSTTPGSAAVLVIGNEILSGRTRDANVQTIGGALAGIGIRLREVRVVEDREDAIVEAVNALRARYDWVFTTGGIGPTHDDITTDCIAAAFGVTAPRNEEAARRLRAYYGEAEATEVRLRMARIPEGAALIDNPVSAAPGFRLGNVHVLPGVPRILQAMLPGVLAELPGGTPIVSRTVVAWIRESDIANELAAVQAQFPALDLGSYPFMREEKFGTSLVARGADEPAVVAAASAIEAFLAARGAQFDPAA